MFAAGQIETWVFRVSVAIPVVCLAALLLWHLVVYLRGKLVGTRLRVPHLKPTLAELLGQYRDRYAGETFDAEIIKTLQQQTKDLKTAPATWRVVFSPTTDLPEQTSLALLILPPDCCPIEELPSAAEQRILSLSRDWGSERRQHRDTLLFLVPSPRGLVGLRKAVLEVTALEAVTRDCVRQLDEEQRAELNQKLGKARAAVSEALGPAYATVARVENEKVAIVPLSEIKSDLQSHLQAAWEQLVYENQWIE